MESKHIQTARVTRISILADQSWQSTFKVIDESRHLKIRSSVQLLSTEDEKILSASARILERIANETGINADVITKINS